MSITFEVVEFQENHSLDTLLFLFMMLIYSTILIFFNFTVKVLELKLIVFFSIP